MFQVDLMVNFELEKTFQLCLHNYTINVLKFFTVTTFQITHSSTFDTFQYILIIFNINF